VAIEAILKENYSEEQITSFYHAFAEDFDSFKVLHDDAYIVMCTSIDFKKFKDEMLKFKKTSSADSGENKK
jgi:hypothetical protein